MNYKEAEEHCIFKFISGSQAYGTNTPESDEDYRGVFIAPFEYFFNIFSGAQEEDQISIGVETVNEPGNDSELQELRKFLKLAADCNPNIVEFLYVDRLILKETDMWKKIRDNRGMFLSKKAKFTFTGYAIAQLRRIKTHRDYLLNPPKKKPERTDYGLPIGCKVPKELQNILLTVADSWFSDEMREAAIKEKQYTSAMINWVAYENWKKNRNPKRQIIENKFGYDTKHAMHLVRLILMCEEILTQGTLTVYEPERAELLLGIRNGAWTYDELEKFANSMDEKLNGLYDISTLRDKPDRKGIQNLYIEICEEHYNIKLFK
jgi:uncharacterized protein